MGKNSDLKFKPGFRLSILDILVLVVSFFGAFKVYELSAYMAFIILFVIGHFFIFCNVIRINWKSEIIWATFFVFLGASKVPVGWHFTLSFLLTLILVYIDIKKPSYHGAFWKILNPKLMDWFVEKKGFRRTENKFEYGEK